MRSEDAIDTITSFSVNLTYHLHLTLRVDLFGLKLFSYRMAGGSLSEGGFGGGGAGYGLSSGGGGGYTGGGGGTVGGYSGGGGSYIIHSGSERQTDISNDEPGFVEITLVGRLFSML